MDLSHTRVYPRLSSEVDRLRIRPVVVEGIRLAVVDILLAVAGSLAGLVDLGADRTALPEEVGLGCSPAVRRNSVGAVHSLVAAHIDRQAVDTVAVVPDSLLDLVAARLVACLRPCASSRLWCRSLGQWHQG
jgi:hypothetical protein